MLRKVALGDRRARYELAGKRHEHLVCDGCGAIWCIRHHHLHGLGPGGTFGRVGWVPGAFFGLGTMAIQILAGGLFGMIASTESEKRKLSSNTTATAARRGLSPDTIPPCGSQDRPATRPGALRGVAGGGFGEEGREVAAGSRNS